MINKSFFVIASVVTTLGVVNVLPVRAGCYVNLASRSMENYIAGGASLNQALQYAYNEGDLDGSTPCAFKFKGYVRRMGTVFPYLYQAMYGSN